MLLIKGGTVYSEPAGPVAQDILVEDGIITQVAPCIDLSGVPSIDATGRHVLPGLIDPATAVGALDVGFRVRDHDELSNPVCPGADVRYAFNPNEAMTEGMFEAGITTMGLCPGNTNVIGGRCAVVSTYGRNAGQMTVRAFTGLKGSVAGYSKQSYGKRNVTPMSRMGIFALLEGALRDEHTGAAQESMDAVRSGRVPFFVQAEQAADIHALLHALTPYPDIRLVVTGGYQAHLCVDALLARGAGLIVGELAELSQGLYGGTDLAALKPLAEKGLLAFSACGGSGPRGKVHYLWMAARFRQAGYSQADVLDMMTTVPARMLGVEDRKGSIAPGKDADLAIFTRNPADCYGALNTCTVVSGKIAFQREVELCC